MQEQQVIYKPTGAVCLADMTVSQIRCFLQGDGGTGKTWSSLTFPNPTILSLDRGAGAHVGRSDVYEVPMYDDAFVKTICPDSQGVVNRKEAIVKWLKTEGQKLTSQQTLVVDNLTGIATAFHLYEDAHPTYSVRTGKVDEFAVWSNKVDYFGELCNLLKSLRCHVVFIGHETPDRDKNGEYNGKFRPMITGQFADQLRSHFTDYLRQLVCAKPDLSKADDKMVASIKANWNMSLDEFKTMCDSFKCPSLYYWQLYSDDLCNCKVSTMVGFPKYVPARYESFIKYLRK